ncbi:MAG: hypothetical protein LQ347_005383 [Umbilicaria vellea]|nr:MAG: hypothetical protein LQ347_005383 [Umbilicaria vellea]
MKSHSLRRGGQFVLVKHGLDRDTVHSLMDDENDSRANLAHISKVSTSNVQALTKDLPTSDTTKLSNISLGRVEGAPTGPSIKAVGRLETDDIYAQLVKSLETVRSVWYDCKKYTTSQSAAKEPHLVQWQAYETARKAKARYAQCFLEVSYSEEYKEPLNSMSMAKAQPLQEIKKTPRPVELTAVGNAHVLVSDQDLEELDRIPHPTPH